MVRVQVWWLASRPKTLWASVSPVIIGSAMAFEDGLWHGPSALVALVVAVLIQIGTNFANDYFDFLKGADTSERVGPLRATQAGLVKPETMRRAFILVFGLAILFGLFLVWRGGWLAFWTGLICILAGLLYTATPFATAYTGFADLFVLVFFGPVAVAGTYYVQGLNLDVSVLIAGLAPGLISTAILVVNNLRDMEQDRTAGKYTLAVRFGKRFSQLEYLILLILAACIPILLYIYAGTHFFALSAILTMVFVVPPIKTVFTYSESALLNATLAETGKFLLIFSIVFSLGWNL